MAREKKKPAKVEQDMTPMIDVVFQLIIFFILTMTVTSPDLRPVQLPTALTAVEENPREQITMLHMYNDSPAATDMSDATVSDPGKGEFWHVTLSRDARRFVSMWTTGAASEGQGVAQIMKDLPDALIERASKWKPGPEDSEQEPTRENAGQTIFNMPVLIRGDMRAPILFFASIVKACETAKIWRVQVSIAPPPDVISGGNK